MLDIGISFSVPLEVFSTHLLYLFFSRDYLSSDKYVIKVREKAVGGDSPAGSAVTRGRCCVGCGRERHERQLGTRAPGLAASLEEAGLWVPVLSRDSFFPPPFFQVCHLLL